VGTENETKVRQTEEHKGSVRRGRSLKLGVTGKVESRQSNKVCDICVNIGIKRIKMVAFGGDRHEEQVRWRQDGWLVGWFDGWLDGGERESFIALTKEEVNNSPRLNRMEKFDIF
jgi:hypothetical protein